MKAFFLLSFFLAANVPVFCQEVISPASFLSFSSTGDDDESEINVNELPGSAGFLFPLTSILPSNTTTPGDLFSSAKLIKSSNSGAVTGMFTVATDTILRTSYRGMHARVYLDEILFFVSYDSVVNQNDPINKGILLYHLDSSTLTVLSVDTFFNVIPTNTILDHWDLLLSPVGSIYNSIVFRPFGQSSILRNTRIVKMRPSGAGATLEVLDINNQFIPGMSPNGFHYSFNSRWNSSFDSVEVFMSSADNIVNQQIFRLVTVDTALIGLENTNILNGSIQYEPGLTVSAKGFNHGLRSGYRYVFVGPYLSKNVSYDLVGMVRYDLNSETFDKELLIPDSGFSFPFKYYTGFESTQEKDGNIFCLASDYSTPANIFFNTVSNHLYVGKSDTSLSGWSWYKYIGNPGMYHVPYRILATSDGGCIITCGIYDYAVSANLQHDIYVIKLNSNGFITNVTNLSNNSGKSLLIYPVPAQNQLFLSNSTGEDYAFVLWDVTGKVMMTRSKITEATKAISLTDLSPGSYFYKVLFKGGQVQTGKIIKQ